MSDPVASEPSDAEERRFRPHPLDLLVLVLAAALAVVAYAYLFKTTPVPLPADRWLGAKITVVFNADRAWKEEFPDPETDRLQIEEYINVRPLGPTEKVVREEHGRVFTQRELELEVLGRDSQRVDRLSAFREGIRRGAVFWLNDHRNQVEVEVVDVQLRGNHSASEEDE